MFLLNLVGTVLLPPEGRHIHKRVQQSTGSTVLFPKLGLVPVTVQCIKVGLPDCATG